MNPNSQNDNFIFNFPSDFVPDYIEEKYKIHLKNFRKPFASVWDYVNSNIKDVTLPGITIPSVVQKKMYGKERNMRSAKSPYDLSSREFTITLRNTDFHIFYYILKDILYYHYSKNGKPFIDDFTVTIVDNQRREHLKVYLKEVLFLNISDLRLANQEKNVDEQEVVLSFLYNFEDIEYIPKWNSGSPVGEILDEYSSVLLRNDDSIIGGAINDIIANDGSISQLDNNALSGGGSGSPATSLCEVVENCPVIKDLTTSNAELKIQVNQIATSLGDYVTTEHFNDVVEHLASTSFVEYLISTIHVDTTGLASTSFVEHLVSLKEDFIVGGNVNQYWRGDKTWQNLNVHSTTAGNGLSLNDGSIELGGNLYKDTFINGSNFDLNINVNEFIVNSGTNSSIFKVNNKEKVKIDDNGFGIGTHLNNKYAYIKTDNITNTTYFQLPNKSGQILLTSDLGTAGYATTSYVNTKVAQIYSSQGNYLLKTNYKNYTTAGLATINYVNTQDTVLNNKIVALEHSSGRVEKSLNNYLLKANYRLHTTAGYATIVYVNNQDSIINGKITALQSSSGRIEKSLNNYLLKTNYKDYTTAGLAYLSYVNFQDNLINNKVIALQNSSGRVEANLTSVSNNVTSIINSKGQPFGIATLGADSKVPLSQIPQSLLGATVFQGFWNASTNTPHLQSGSGTKGQYYIVTVGGNTNLDGGTDWKIGDWAIFLNTTWGKVDNTDAVVSVNGKVGVITIPDYTSAGLVTLLYVDTQDNILNNKIIALQNSSGRVESTYLQKSNYKNYTTAGLASINYVNTQDTIINNKVIDLQSSAGRYDLAISGLQSSSGKTVYTVGNQIINGTKTFISNQNDLGINILKFGSAGGVIANYSSAVTSTNTNTLTFGNSTWSSTNVQGGNIFLTANGNIFINNNTDFNTVIGRGIVGIAGVTNTFSLGHTTGYGTTTYMIRQTSSNKTTINSGAGQITDFAIANVTIASLSNNSFVMGSTSGFIRSSNYYVNDWRSGVNRIALDTNASNTLRLGGGFSTLTTPSNINLSDTTAFPRQIFAASSTVTAVLGGGWGFLNIPSGVQSTKSNNLTTTPLSSYAVIGSFTTSTGSNYGAAYSWTSATVNQTGSYTGVMAGLYIAPTVGTIVGTLAGVYTNITANPTGGGQAYAQYHVGTAPSYFGGNILMGSTSGNIQSSNYYVNDWRTGVNKMALDTVTSTSLGLGRGFSSLSTPATSLQFTGVSSSNISVTNSGSTLSLNVLGGAASNSGIILGTSTTSTNTNNNRNIALVSGNYTIANVPGAGTFQALRVRPTLTLNGASNQTMTMVDIWPSVNSLTVNTKLYGLRSRIESTSGMGTTYNIYADGSAPNLFNGATTINNNLTLGTINNVEQAILSLATSSGTYLLKSQYKDHSTAGYSTSTYVNNQDNLLQNQITALQSSSGNVVYLTGNQSIDGIKTFTNNTNINNIRILKFGSSGLLTANYIPSITSTSNNVLTIGNNGWTQTNLVASTNIFLNSGNGVFIDNNSDKTTVIGRASISAGVTNTANFSHLSFANNTGYALRQNSVGGTVLNAASSQQIQFAINGSQVGRFGGNGFLTNGTAGFMTTPNLNIIDWRIGNGISKSALDVSAVNTLRVGNGFGIVQVPGQFRIDGQLLIGNGTDLQIRDAAGSIGTRAITGFNYLRGGNQSATTPTYSFTNASGMGMYAVSGVRTGFAVAGIQKFEINNNSVVVTSTLSSVNSTSGALIVNGGIGVFGPSNFGNTLSMTNASATLTTLGPTILTNGAIRTASGGVAYIPTAYSTIQRILQFGSAGLVSANYLKALESTALNTLELGQQFPTINVAGKHQFNSRGLTITTLDTNLGNGLIINRTSAANAGVVQFNTATSTVDYAVGMNANGLGWYRAGLGVNTVINLTTTGNVAFFTGRGAAVNGSQNGGTGVGVINIQNAITKPTTGTAVSQGILVSSENDSFYLRNSGGILGSFSSTTGLAVPYDISATVAGKGFKIKEGSNARMGVATLVAGTVTVANTSVTANTRIMLTTQSVVGTVGVPYISARIASTSFTISSSAGGLDGSTVAWMLVEPA